MSDLQSKVPSFATELNSPSVFKEIYEFAFLWSREALDKKNLGKLPGLLSSLQYMDIDFDNITLEILKLRATCWNYY